MVEQMLAFTVQVTQAIGLEPVSQYAKQQVAGQVRGCRSPKHSMPAAAKFADAEIAKARDLGVELLSVQ